MNMIKTRLNSSTGHNSIAAAVVIDAGKLVVMWRLQLRNLHVGEPNIKPVAHLSELGGHTKPQQSAPHLVQAKVISALAMWSLQRM
jgi:hypothetical protein